MRTTPWKQVRIKALLKILEDGNVPKLAHIATEQAEPVIYNELCAEYYGPLDGVHFMTEAEAATLQADGPSW